MDSPLFSVVIPCYNTEKTLKDTLLSVQNQKFKNWQAIIVNDGSEDNLKVIALIFCENDSRFMYFEKKNGGLASARNFGISKSSGKYILPLDSDNLLEPNFLKDAINILNNNIDVDVIYGNAEYFGERTGVWKVGSFDKLKMLTHNYIDACAIIKKTVFDELGCYDENLPYQGHEDWEFWLRLMSNNKKFIYHDKIVFKYRVSSDSMIRSFNEDMIASNVNYIRKKYSDYYFKFLTELAHENKILKRELGNKPTIKLTRMAKKFLRWLKYSKF